MKGTENEVNTNVNLGDHDHGEKTDHGVNQTDIYQITFLQ